MIFDKDNLIDNKHLKASNTLFLFFFNLKIKKYINLDVNFKKNPIPINFNKLALKNFNVFRSKNIYKNFYCYKIFLTKKNYSISRNFPENKFFLKKKHIIFKNQNILHKNNFFLKLGCFLFLTNNYLCNFYTQKCFINQKLKKFKISLNIIYTFFYFKLFDFLKIFKNKNNINLLHIYAYNITQKKLKQNQKTYFNKNNLCFNLFDVKFRQFLNVFFNFFKLNLMYNFKKPIFFLNFSNTQNSFKLNLSYFLNYLLFTNDLKVFNKITINFNFISNTFLKNFFNFFGLNYNFNSNNSLDKKFFKIYSNYYPIFLSNRFSFNKFFQKYKNNYDISFISFTNKFVISFLEKNIKKRIFIKYINNFNNQINNYYLDFIINDHKRFQPAYWKNFLVNDFIKILWYSFFLKDLNMISEWISIFMEKMHFKNHKKFLSFFFNFINKYSDIFINILKIKGFFFDIRGKVGVTGSSKKRHLFFKFGPVNKSSKKTKINWNQSLVRTYSGVMGLTYIINY